MYSAVPPAIENSTFRFHRCSPTTAAEASSSGAHWYRLKARVLPRRGLLVVIARLRAAPGQMLLVYDEYGHFEGVVTPMDVLEAITGEFVGWDDDEPKVVEREDGSLLVAGWMPADEFADRLSLPLPEDHDYSTVAGMVLDLMGRLPQAGDSVRWQGWRIEVVDLDGRRIDKLLVNRLPR